MKLYDIDKAISDCVDAETGEIIDFEKLEALQMEREKKIDNIACWYKSLLSDAEGIKKEKEALAQRQKVKENEAARIKEYLSYLLEGQKLETSRNKISWRTSKQVHITDISQVLSNEAYIKPRKYDESEINKTAVKEALLAGENVPGAELVTNLNLQIK